MPRVQTRTTTVPVNNSDFSHSLSHLVTLLTRDNAEHLHAQRHGCPHQRLPVSSLIHEARQAIQAQFQNRRQYLERSQLRKGGHLQPALLAARVRVPHVCQQAHAASDMSTHTLPAAARRAGASASANGRVRGSSATQIASPAAGGVALQLSAIDAATASDDPLTSAGEHSHGFLAVDLDEAVHGVYAATKQGLAVREPTSADPHPGNPLQTNAIDLLPNSAADAALSLGAGALVLPLAALAIHGGAREFQQASALKKRLKRSVARVQEEQEQARGLPGALGAALQQRVLESASAVRLKNLKNAQQTEGLNRGIGVSSAASGATIALKAAGDIGMTVGFGVQATVSGQGFVHAAQTVSGGTGVAAAGVGAAGVFALASAWVVAPLAGIFATALGALLLHKTRTHRARLKHAWQQTESNLNASVARSRMTGHDTVISEAYRAFLQEQARNRLDFLRTFKRWNTLFVAGSGLYAASAIAKGVIIGLSVAGLTAAASNPVGAGILLGVGLAGAVAMAIGSIAFFTGHDKQNRYARSAYLDHESVDRHFLSVHQFLNNVQQSPEPALAPQLLNVLNQRAEGIQTLLVNCAKNVGKVAPRTVEHTLWNRLRRRCLTANDLDQWLATADGHKAYTTFLRAELTARSEWLSNKLKAGLQMAQQQLDLTDTHRSAPDVDVASNAGTNPSTRPDPFAGINIGPDSGINIAPNDHSTLNITADDQLTPSHLSALVQFFSRFDSRLEAIQSELEICRSVLNKLNASLDAPENNNDADWYALTGDLLLPGHDIQNRAQLAAHLLSEVHESVKAAKDCLFDTELDSTRIQQAFASQRAACTSGGATLSAM